MIRPKRVLGSIVGLVLLVAATMAFSWSTAFAGSEPERSPPGPRVCKRWVQHIVGYRLTSFGGWVPFAMAHPPLQVEVTLFGNRAGVVREIVRVKNPNGLVTQTSHTFDPPLEASLLLSGVTVTFNRWSCLGD